MDGSFGVLQHVIRPFVSHSFSGEYGAHTTSSTIASSNRERSAKPSDNTLRTNCRLTHGRELWQHRTQQAAAFVARGDLHLTVLLLSSATLALTLCIRSLARVYTFRFAWSAKSELREAWQPTILLPYAFAQMTAAIAACCLGWLSAQRTESWKQQLLLTYVVLLGIARLGLSHKDFSRRIYHQMNAVVSLAFLLDAVQDVGPLMIVGATSRPTTIDSVKVACLAAAAFIPFITPRARRLRGTQDAVEDLSLEKEPSPEETCSLISYFWSYEWITYVILRAYRRDLVMDDLPSLPSYDQPWLWFKKIRKERMRGGKTFRTLCRLMKTEIKTMMGWSASTAVAELVAPFAMLKLLGYLENPQDAVVHPALWIALLFVGPTLQSICWQQYIFTSTQYLVRVNMSLVQDIYHTAMSSHIYDSSVDESAAQLASAGSSTNSKKGAAKSAQANLVSLMSYDVDAIYRTKDVVFLMVSVPISTTIAMVFLYRILGWPSLVGVLTLVCLTPLPTMASRTVSRIQRSVMQATDARLSKISEYLSSIRNLKYFGWEPAAMEQINQARGLEQRLLWKRSIRSVSIYVAGEFLPLTSLLIMFCAYVFFTGQPLRAPVAFTSLSIMENLRGLFSWLSGVVRMAAQGAESIRRIDEFFDKAEEIKRHPDGPLEFKDASFRRTPIASFRLQDLTLRFKDNALNVVAGPTGCGKTSLLLSLLGETILEKGSATCPRDVAYVPQAAWLQNDTIRQNILFYSEYDKARYEAVIDASGLRPDLEQLPDGDLTEVGERGTTLSGGQKQRVSLARALYSRSHTILLDDIFSALDTHTTTLVYQKCFRSDLLAGRTVVLVTHYPVALRDASMVVLLKDGRITNVTEKPESCDEQEPTEQGDFRTAESESTLTVSEGEQGSETVTDLPSKPQALVENQLKRMAKETSLTGRIPRSLVLQYMAEFGGLGYAALMFVSAIAGQVSYFSITYWLSIWTEAYEKYARPNTAFYLSVYAATIVAFLSLQTANILLYLYGGWRAAKKMHARLVTAVLSAPIGWFDENPIGRAINRFGNDTRSMDSVLIDFLRSTVENGLRFVLRIVSIASIMPIFALPAAVVCAIGFLVGDMYTRAQVPIKRLVSVNYSPIFSHFTDTLAGLTVIRARENMDDVFKTLLAERLAVHARSAKAQYNCNRWVSVRTDFCAASVAAAAGCIAYYSSGSAGLVGFSLTNAIGLSETILMLVRSMNDLEVELNSYQRMREYADIEPEGKVASTTKHDQQQQQAEAASRSAVAVPAAWPTSGRVKFHNVRARYRTDGPEVLRNVTFATRPGERIAIVGRTGSGKSTLALSLLRFVQITSGQVTIDGVDISTVPLHRLRTSVTLIPQEPVLFSGTVETNLDPFGESSESELRSALAACASIQVHTKSIAAKDDEEVEEGAGGAVPAPPNEDNDDEPIASETRSLSLNSPVAANGENFSQGQRQVLSLARAMCRRSKIVLLDEATASVDHETDRQMQKLLRSEFPDSTIIAIAHRLRTIMDYDRVLVMADGEIVECDSPAKLIAREGVFWSMLKNTGEFEELTQMVKPDA